MLKNVFLLILGIFIGYSSKPVVEEVLDKYNQYLDLKHKPNLKVGDCFRFRGSENKNFYLTDANEYGYTIGTNCAKQKFACDFNFAPAREVDSISTKTECPITIK